MTPSTGGCNPHYRIHHKLRHWSAQRRRRIQHALCALCKQEHVKWHRERRKERTILSASETCSCSLRYVVDAPRAPRPPPRGRPGSGRGDIAVGPDGVYRYAIGQLYSAGWADKFCLPSSSHYWVQTASFCPNQSQPKIVCALRPHLRGQKNFI